MTKTESPSPRRQRSRQQLLDVIRRESGITRPDLSLLTGLSRSAIAEAVQDLLDDKLIKEDVLEAGGKGAGRGRPSALLVPTRPEGSVVGIDFGHHHVAVAVADALGNVLTEQRSALNVDVEALAALDVASGMVHRLLGQVGQSISDVIGIAAGIPAPIELKSRLIRSSSSMSGWVDVNPEQELERRLGRPVTAANDADLGAMGEMRFGAARGYRDFVYIKASAGVGASLVLNGGIYQGSAGLAGEIGHTQLGEQGSWCRCGNRGCLETVVSTNLVNTLIRNLGIAIDPSDTSLAGVAQNPVVARFLTEAGRTLGRVIADICNCLNPSAVILGGELGTAGRPVVDGVRQSIDRYAQPAVAQAVNVHAADLGVRAELVGAIAQAMNQALLPV